MDRPDAPLALLEIFHRDLAWINKMLGYGRELVQRVKASGPSVRSVIDLGCGDGALLAQIRKATGVSVTGVDLKPPACSLPGIPVVRADATRDSLPTADIALCCLTLHHLSPPEIVGLIRNAGRSCKRLIVLDLVRHPLPLALFSAFIGPMVHRVTSDDGRISISRAYTRAELAALVHTALEGTPARVQHCVSLWRTRQIIDITYRPSGVGDPPGWEEDARQEPE